MAMTEKSARHVGLATDVAAAATDPFDAIKLSARDTQTFVQALIEPTPVNRRLLKTVRRYRHMSGA
jgi:uncharacterized protein (DUF1778 family)